MVWDKCWISLRSAEQNTLIDPRLSNMISLHSFSWLNVESIIPYIILPELFIKLQDLFPVNASNLTAVNLQASIDNSMASVYHWSPLAFRRYNFSSYTVRSLRSASNSTKGGVARVKPCEANRMTPTLLSFSASRSTRALMRYLATLIRLEKIWQTRGWTHSSPDSCTDNVICIHRYWRK